MRGAGLGDAPRTLVEEFANPSLRSRTWIKSGDVVLKARRADGQESHIRLRCVTPPDKTQKVLLHRLGLTLPQRLRTVDEVEQMYARWTRSSQCSHDLESKRALAPPPKPIGFSNCPTWASAPSRLKFRVGWHGLAIARPCDPS